MVENHSDMGFKDIQIKDQTASTYDIVSVLHQDEGGIEKSIPDGQKISWDPRDFPRAKR